MQSICLNKKPQQLKSSIAKRVRLRARHTCFPIILKLEMLWRQSVLWTLSSVISHPSLRIIIIVETARLCCFYMQAKKKWTRWTMTTISDRLRFMIKSSSICFHDWEQLLACRSRQASNVLERYFRFDVSLLSFLCLRMEMATSRVSGGSDIIT